MSEDSKPMLSLANTKETLKRTIDNLPQIINIADFDWQISKDALIEILDHLCQENHNIIRTAIGINILKGTRVIKCTDVKQAIKMKDNIGRYLPDSGSDTSFDSE